VDVERSTWLSCQIVDGASARERPLHEFVASRTTIVVLCRPQQQFH
jgi:hypothetical protein